MCSPVMNVDSARTHQALRQAARISQDRALAITCNPGTRLKGERMLKLLRATAH